MRRAVSPLPLVATNILQLDYTDMNSWRLRLSSTLRSNVGLGLFNVGLLDKRLSCAFSEHYSMRVIDRADANGLFVSSNDVICNKMTQKMQAHQPSLGASSSLQS